MILSIRELRNNLLWTALSVLICFVCFNTVFSSLTNIGASIYQRKEFEENINVDLNNVFHLYFQDIDESDDYIKRVNAFIEELNNKYTIGRYDQRGEYFLELMDNKKYIELNQKILADNASKYINRPETSRIMYIDEKMFSLISGIDIKYAGNNEYLPVYVSSSFGEVIPKGMVLTSELNGEQFRVSGYIEKSLMFFDENDIIRFPLISLDGFFVAPFPESYKEDVMSVLSTLHNTYVISDDDIGNDILTASNKYQLNIDISLLSEEYIQYLDEEEYFIKAQIILSIFISLMALSCLVSIFSADTLLNKRNYGIYLSNGYSRYEIVRIIFYKIFIIVSLSCLLSYLYKYFELIRNDSVSIRLFRNILIRTHIYFSLPFGSMLCVFIVLFSVIMPSLNIFRYEPYELAKGA